MRRFVQVLLSLALVGGVLLTTGCMDKLNYLRARNELNHGVRAFSQSNYQAAVQRFDQAIEYDPELLAARSYRASSFMMQYIPGGESEENMQIARQALDGFQGVLERDEKNEIALASIASLYFSMREFELSKETYRALIGVNPQNKEAHYTIGVINWSITFPRDMQVRAEIGMQLDEPGPIKDDEARQELAEENLPLIEEALEALNAAIEIDPQYDDAMAYVNLLYRRWADIAESTEEYEKYTTTADEWVQKSLETKKIKAEAAIQEFQ